MNSTFEFFNKLKNQQIELKDCKLQWQSPSNIALVKYWGKKEIQIPENLSISMGLKNCFTQTQMVAKCHQQNKMALEYFFSNERHLLFETKVMTFLNHHVLPLMPFLSKLSLTFNSSNSFPHSAGIASSASSMSALALCLMDLATKLFNLNLPTAEFFQHASYLARLGSGSACRSIYGGFSRWGELNENDGSNEYALKIEKIHPLFMGLKDTIVIVDSGPKEVSSSNGHKLMATHDYADQRYQRADKNAHFLIEVLEKGDMENFGRIIESEAFDLHGLMMSSSTPFILLRPKTLEVIELVKQYRNENKTPIYFTLDAGPNVHLLYPPQFHSQISQELFSKIKSLDCPLIFDEIGNGPVKIDG